MGRTGVTLEEVESAALQLQGRGKNPSVDAIREILGTGSKTTIAHHLRDWKVQQSNAAGNLPHELMALVTGLWERLNALADQHIIEIQKKNTEQVQALKKELIELHQKHAHLQKDLHHGEESLSAERAAKEQVIKELQSQQQEQTKLLERYEAMTQRLEDHKAENNRLHQLAANLQANLEHYQNSVQRLHVEQSLVIEKQQNQFQKEIASLQTELASHTKQPQELERQLHHKTLELEQLQKQHTLLEKNHGILVQQEQKNSHALGVLEERCEQALKTIAERDKELTTKTHRITELEKQMAVLREQTTHLEQGLTKANDKIETLRHEKQFLAQEKHELQGYLKQLELSKKKTIVLEPVE